MKVLMVGATGKYVSLVVPELKQRGVTIRALVWDKDKTDTARQQGADEAVVGDLNDAETLRAAASGMEGDFHLTPAFAPNEAELGVVMVEAAKEQEYGSSSSLVSFIRRSLHSVTMLLNVWLRKHCTSQA